MNGSIRSRGHAGLALALCLACGLGLALASAPAFAQDPVVAGPSIYKEIFENDRVRVFEVTFRPGAEMPLHSHPDHVAYVVAGGKLRITGTDGSVIDLDLKPGDTHFLPAQAHTGKNLGRSTLKVIVTDLKEAAVSPKLTDGERLQILDLLERGRTQLAELVARTPDELWDKKPAPDRWSVAEVVEHLGTTERLLTGMAQQMLTSPIDPNWTSVAARTSADGLAQAVEDRSRKAQAPEPVQPKGGMSRQDALAAFGSARLITEDWVRRTDAPLKQHVATLPPGTMNVHQVLVLIGAHTLRHNKQIAEVLAELQP